MRFFIVFVSLFFFQTKYSQNISGIENFVLVSEDDRALITQEYFKPLFNSMQVSMGEGWIKSAKTHKKLGFDFTFLLSAINIPVSSREFSNLNLSSISSSSNTSPTIFGGESNEDYFVEFNSPGTDYSLSTTFNVPGGHEGLLTRDMLLLPNLQFSIGLPFETDLIIRYMPRTEKKGARYQSYGVGFKHGLMQYFKPAEATPFNLSTLLIHSNIAGDYVFGVNSEIPGENQSIELNVSNTSAGLVASLDLKVVSIYSSVSQVFSKSSLKVKGAYEVNYQVSSSETENIEFIFNDPISIENKLNYIRKNIGVSFNLAFTNIFIDYSIYDYSSINIGLSFGVR